MPNYSTSAYESPERVVSMLFDGELTGKGLFQAIASPTSLTPKELEGFKFRLKKAAGDRPVSDAFVDVLTDPWVWLFAVTSPVGLGSVSHAWRDVAPRVTALVRKEAGPLASLGAMTEQQVLRGTSVSESVFTGERGMSKFMQQKFLESWADRFHAFVRENGLDPRKGLDWERYRKGSPERDLARRTSALLWAKMERWNEAALTDKVFQVALRGDVKKAAQKGKKLPPGPSLRDVKRERLLNQDPSGVARRLGVVGFDEMVDHTRTLLKETQEFAVEDGRSLIRHWRGLAGESGVKNARVKNVASRLVKALGQYNAKPAVIEGFVGSLAKTMYGHNAGHYMPRRGYSTYEVRYNKLGRALGDELETHAFPTGLRAPKSARGRAPSSLAIHPELYEELGRMAGFTKAGAKLRRLIQTRAGAARNGPQRFLDLNFQRAIHGHLKDAKVGYGLYGQPLSAELRAVNKEGVALRRKAIAEGHPIREVKYADGSSNLESLDDLIALGKEPLGGHSVADVLVNEADSLTDTFARETISEIVLPRLQGTVATHHALGASAVQMGRKMSAAFLSVKPVRDAIERSGDFGKRFIGGLEEFAEGADDLGKARSLTNNAARYLYVTHLANVPSLIVNSTQPWLLAGSVAGYKNISRGYGDAFREIGAYMKSRAGSGFKPISNVERETLGRRHISVWDEAGLSTDFLENMERMTAMGEHMRRSPSGPWKRWVLEYPLKGFEKVEWLNRSVVAHAVRHNWVGAGGHVDDPLLKVTQRELVHETQFGGHWMNTPLGFLPRRGEAQTTMDTLAKNPLTRMFTSFMLRSAVASTHTASRLGGGEGFFSLSGQEAFVKTSVRAMGMSALGVYLARDLLGADMERAGYLSAATDVIPGIRSGRFEKDDSLIPVPPVAQIAYDLLVGIPTGEKRFLRDVAPRLVPGGLQLKRTIDTLPGPLPGQSTYAAWGEAERDREGATQVPVFRAEDGTFLGYRPAMDLLLKGVGADLGKYNKAFEVERALLAGRETAVALRRDAVRALLANDSSGYQKASATFKKRFGIDLVVSQRHLDQGRRLQTQSRPERIAGQLPSDIRPQYEDAYAKDLAQAAGPGADPVSPRSPGQSSRGSLPGSNPRNDRFEPFSGFKGF